MENEEIWQIINYLTEIGLPMKSVVKDGAYLKIAVEIPILNANSTSRHT
jgi:hypothetical protein